jgi:hypothetical protein
MIPNKKFSQTIMAFGEELVLALPNNCSVKEMEVTMGVIITVWNSVVMDNWNNKNNFENELIKIMKDKQKQTLIIAKRLIKQEK